MRGTNLQAPDMEDVKDSVKQGVKAVSGRLSGMASGVMNQLQVRYDY
jgi:ADP-ribosylation factor GTPase-activating protein 2/3